MWRTTRSCKPPLAATPLFPEEQGHPVVEVHEALVDGRTIATVSLTVDRQTWIAGMTESQSNAHIGNFASLDEAKYAVNERLESNSKAIQWVRGRIVAPH